MAAGTSAACLPEDVELGCVLEKPELCPVFSPLQEYGKLNRKSVVVVDWDNRSKGCSANTKKFLLFVKELKLGHNLFNRKQNVVAAVV